MDQVWALPRSLCRFGLVWGLAAAGCGGTTPPAQPAPAPLGETESARDEIDGAPLPGMPMEIKPGEELAAAEQAYNLGDPVRALRIAEGIAETDPQRGQSGELVAKARADSESMAHDWLDVIEGLVKQKQYRAARARALYLLDNFPVTPELRGLIESRLEQIRAGVRDARVEIRELRAQAAERLLQRDFVGALKALRRAEVSARAFNFRDALDIERQITAAEFRFAQERMVASLQPGDGTRKKPAAKKKKIGDKEVLVEEAGPAESGESPHAKEVQELLRAAARHQKNKAYYQAIVAFENVRELDPANSAAKVALEGLKSAREALIKEYLAKANESFLKQDLAGAVPYFKKVRVLDPANQEAEEGLMMYENLERIRQQRAEGR